MQQFDLNKFTSKKKGVILSRKSVSFYPKSRVSVTYFYYCNISSTCMI